MPSLCRSGDLDLEQDSDAEEEKEQKYGKAAILTRALEYIKHLELTTQRLGSEVGALKTRIAAFERLAVSGSLGGSGSGGGGIVYAGIEVKKETLKDIQAGMFTKPETT